MTVRRSTRIDKCSRSDGATRLVHAECFLETAILVADTAEDQDGASNVAVSLAVLAGIAAADAACCRLLGRRNRSPNHHDAEQMLSEITAGGITAAADLRRLLDLKDQAQYGGIHVGAGGLKASLRQAQRVLEFARRAG